MYLKWVYLIFFFIQPFKLFSQKFPDISDIANSTDIATGIQLLILLSILSLAPSLIIMFTSFIRIVIVFSFVKLALSLQQVPPTQVIVSMSLFLSLFIMMPSLENIYRDAYLPLKKKEINLEIFYQRVMKPLREFMFKQIGKQGRESFVPFIRIANLPWPKSESDIPNHILIPSFILNELKHAFYIGIIIFIPFIIIDLLIASILMSMGMIMLPPIMISLPFKIVLFILIGGWDLIVEQLLRSF